MSFITSKPKRENNTLLLSVEWTSLSKAVERNTVAPLLSRFYFLEFQLFTVTLVQKQMILFLMY